MAQVLKSGAGMKAVMPPQQGSPITGGGVMNKVTSPTQPPPIAAGGVNNVTSPTQPSPIAAGGVNKVTSPTQPPLITGGGGMNKVTSPTQPPPPLMATVPPPGTLPHPQGAQGPPMKTPGLLNISATGLNVGTQVSPGGGAAPTANASTQPQTNQLPVTAHDTNPSVANTKEKTPMCLVNELARFNKIQHQYTLTDEQGPAHKKTFYVKLNLGDEEYAASGASIKKAQHAAAAIALDKTKHRFPPAKQAPRNDKNGNWWGGHEDSITPTVELNALAMKRGEPAEYRPIEMPRPQNFYPHHQGHLGQHPQNNMDFRGMYGQRYHHNYKYPRVFYMSLKVGQREFIGEGATRQDARHNAAHKALHILRNLPLPNQQPIKKTPEATVPQEDPNEDDDADERDALKSEISLVHEIALKRNLNVKFEVIKESGPPHMKKFVTRCSVGDLVTDGHGNGKKVSKKDAAEKMLKELKALPPLPPSVTRAPRKNTVNKKKNKNLIKVGLQKADPTYGIGINPISRLIQIQQAKKEKEPIYQLVGEKGEPWKREYTMQVTVGSHQCSGIGPNKKLAKRSAAEAMLQLLGYSRPSPQPSKPAIKSQDSQQSGGADKKVTFIDQETHPTRQLVPGLLLMPDGTGPQSTQSYPSNHGYGRQMPGPYSVQTTATIAKELLDKGSSPTAESMNQSSAKPAMSPTQSTVRPRQQLQYLADVLGFPVQFTDFPKGPNKSEFLTLVSLGTTPPSVSHGGGPTLEASQDNACLTALRSLAELGLDQITDKKPAVAEEQLAAGDGTVLKTEVDSEKMVTFGGGDGRPIKQEPK